MVTGPVDFCNQVCPDLQKLRNFTFWANHLVNNKSSDFSGQDSCSLAVDAPPERKKELSLASFVQTGLSSNRAPQTNRGFPFGFPLKDARIRSESEDLPGVDLGSN